VVGDDAERALAGAEVGGRGAGEALGEVDQRGEQRGAVVAADALEHGGEALEAGAGVDARARQRAIVPSASFSYCMNTRFHSSV
jgi:hypothetical protein